MEKLQELLRTETGAIVKDEVEFEADILVTVTRTSISPTLEHATVWISVYPESEREAALKAIQKRIYPIQQALNRRLVLRVVPKIRFEIDESGEHLSKIEEILEKTS